ncbi:hypothetical protein M595_4748 [Lyngbya aestuarii BL J]|uniref:Uncharacterized protein n=1 Tax=Lyngbya aestuarii BL J TaxID=1348334 RepID=U7QE44_9CYAN|nr:hypothetical protein M595_4748 [Lyngbya aestuarii BL J]
MFLLKMVLLRNYEIYSEWVVTNTRVCYLSIFNLKTVL